MDDATNSVHGSFLQALDTGPVKNLVNPITQHLGEALGYIGDIVRFYSHQNLAKVFKKWAEGERGGKSLEEEEFKRVMPLLHLAAQVSDDELQDRWAALLESAAEGKPGFLPSYGQTLSQITAEEAKFLERYFKFMSHPAEGHPRNPKSIGFFASFFLPDGEIWEKLDRETQSQVWARAELNIQDLERLGIFTKDFRRKEDGALYGLSSYGIGFISAVSPQKEL